eukprot:2827024-Lingulodinium_polyedra.AAC.1
MAGSLSVWSVSLAWPTRPSHCDITRTHSRSREPLHSQTWAMHASEPLSTATNTAGEFGSPSVEISTPLRKW